MQHIIISAGTDVGKRRKDNQDTYICQPLWTDYSVLLAVIDGVGGYAGGDKAAAIAKESLLQYMNTPKGDTLTMLREAIVFANNQIFESRSSSGFSDMCCVITAAIADAKAGKFYFAHVGDTRLYHYHNRSLKKITSDHSLVGIREDAGELSEEEAMNHPQRNIILREVGSAVHRIDDADFLEYGVHDFLPGDLLLICSDGLSDMITTEQMISVLTRGDELAKKVTILIDLANEMGGNDNISVVLAKNNSTSLYQKKIPGSFQSEPDEKTTNQNLIMQPRRRHLRNKFLLAGFALLVIAGVAFFWQKIQTLMPSGLTKARDTTKLSVAENKNPSTAIPAPVVSTPKADNNSTREAYNQDTLQVIHPLSISRIKDMSDRRSNYLVLVPATGKGANVTALQITFKDSQFIHHDTIDIRNLYIKDFETGIKVIGPVYVKPVNVVFENVKYPFSYEQNLDSAKQKGLLIINPSNRQ